MNRTDREKALDWIAGLETAILIGSCTAAKAWEEQLEILKRAVKVADELSSINDKTWPWQETFNTSFTLQFNNLLELRELKK